MRLISAAALPFALAVAFSAAGQPPSTTATHALGSHDRKFLTEAARGGLAEVELGRLAAEKASDPDVRAFGQHMVDDHSKANEELKKVAEAKGVVVPTTIGSKEASLKKKLSGLSGAAFDRAYVDAMVKDHRHDVAEFEKQASDARDSDVAAFASKTLPTLREHLSRVEELSKNVKGRSSEAASKGM